MIKAIVSPLVRLSPAETAQISPVEYAFRGTGCPTRVVSMARPVELTKLYLTRPQHNDYVVSVAIPPHQSDGLLPPGVHRCTWAELERRFGASAYRSSLLSGLLEAARMLVSAGCRELYIDGSFVTTKHFPGDFDACWDIAGVNPHLLNPVFFDFANKRAAQKAIFKGELFLAKSIAARGVNYLNFFQKDKNTGMAKGIVSLDLGSLPT